MFFLTAKFMSRDTKWLIITLLFQNISGRKDAYFQLSWKHIPMENVSHNDSNFICSKATEISVETIWYNFTLRIFLFIVYHFASCVIWMWSLVPYIKGGMKAKGIWKLDPEVNICTQVRCEWWVEKSP